MDGPDRTEPPRVEGRLEAVLGGLVIGWAWCPSEPSERLLVTVIIDGQPVASCLADGERASLAAAGIGDGAHAFGAQLPASLGDRQAHTVRVLAEPSRTTLPAALAYASRAETDSSFAGTTFVPADRQDTSPGQERVAPQPAIDPPQPAIHAAQPAARRWWSSDLPESNIAPRWLLAIGCAAYFLLFVYLTRHFSFFQDEYDYVLNRRGWDANTLLGPVNQHLFLIPLLFYKVLFVTVGLHPFWPYQLPVFAMHIACVVALYVLAARRAGPWIALVPAGLLLVLGAGFELELWAIGVSTLGALAAGLWALVLLERGDRRGDIWASALLALSIASYSIALFLAVAIALELALTRWRRLWVVGAPLALYALWYAQYGQGDIVWSNVPKLPGYDLHIAGYAFAGLAGVSASVFGHGALVVGYPLLAGAVLWLVIGVLKRRPPPALAVTGIVAAAGFWAGTALARAQDHEPDASRYVYPSAVLILVAAVSYLHRRRVSVRAAAAVALVGVVIAVLGLAPLRSYSINRTGTDAYVRAALGAAQVAGRAGDPAFRPDPAHLAFMTLGAYLNAVHALGSSAAFTPGQIALMSSDYQELADKTLIDAERIYPLRTATSYATGAGCSRLLGAPPSGMLLMNVNPGDSAYITAAPGASVQLWLRRISATFSAYPQQTIAPGSNARLDFPHDQSSAVWWLQVGASRQPPGSAPSLLATVCVGASPTP